MPSLAKLYYLTAGFKTPIDISEQAGQDLSDYQVKIVLDSSWDGWDKVSPTGSDIFFLDEYGNPLYFWIEKFDKANYSAILWVKLASLLANETKRIYLCYGTRNPYTSYRNPEKVFVFFDDFSGVALDTNKWIQVGGSVSVSGGYLTLSVGSNAWAGVKTRSYFSSRNLAFESRFRISSGDEAQLWVCDFSPTSNPWFSKEWYRSMTKTGTLYIQRYADPDGSQVVLLQESHDGTVFKIYAIMLTNQAKFFVNNSLKCTDTNQFETGDTIYMVLGVWNNGVGIYDWVRIRKYVDPEPSVSIGTSLSLAKDLDLM